MSDRWFNTLKAKYCQYYIYILPQLLISLNICKRITVSEVKVRHFNMYNVFLLISFKNKTSTIKPNHIFTVNDLLEPGTIIRKRDDKGNGMVQKLEKMESTQQFGRKIYAHLVPLLLYHS